MSEIQHRWVKEQVGDLTNPEKQKDAWISKWIEAIHAKGKIVNAQDVFVVQNALKTLWHDPGKLDGVYKAHDQSESHTMRAAKSFQKASGLVEDGWVGPKTLAKMVELFKNGNKETPNAPQTTSPQAPEKPQTTTSATEPAAAPTPDIKQKTSESPKPSAPETVNTSPLEEWKHMEAGEIEKGRLDKMKKSPNSYLRGDINGYHEFLKKQIDTLPGGKIQVPSQGDLHLEQLVFIDGKPQLSDWDESHKNGYFATDMVRVLASVALANNNNRTSLEDFIGDYILALKGKPDLLELPPDLKVTTGKTQQDLLAGYGRVKEGKFEIAKFTGEKWEKNVRKLTAMELAWVYKWLPAGTTVADSIKFSSDGVGSYGQDKIWVLGSDSNIYEVKEQNKDHSAKTGLGIDATDNDRVDVAKTVGASIDTVQIGDTSYTISKLDPNYTGFKITDKTSPEEKKYAGSAVAQELAKVHAGQKDDIMKILTPENMNKYIDTGLAYANQVRSKGNFPAETPKS